MNQCLFPVLFCEISIDKSLNLIEHKGALLNLSVKLEMFTIGRWILHEALSSIDSSRVFRDGLNELVARCYFL